MGAPKHDGVHWLREDGIACDEVSGETTFALGAVTCRACRAAMDGELEFVAWRAAIDAGALVLDA